MTLTGLADKPRATRTQAVLAATIGNALEWFDFTVYALLAVPIAAAFFPKDAQGPALLLTFATLGVSYLARPLGGILLGRYGDRHGRRAALLAVVALMMLATAMLALTPPYAAIGVAAPGLIVVARLIQGFAMGGEFGSATTFLVESAPPGRKGFYVSLQMTGQFGATLLGASLVGTLSAVLTPTEMVAWGWRVPFLVGFVIGPIGLYLRARVGEPVARDEGQRMPCRAVAVTIAKAFGMVALATSHIYIFILYMPSYAVHYLGLPLHTALIATIVSTASGAVICPLAGALSDRLGRRPLVVGAALAMAVVAVPLFALVVHGGGLAALIGVEVVMAALSASYVGPMNAYLAELFPAGIRSTGLGTGYNLAVLCFGGFAPFAVAKLIEVTGSQLMPPVYVVGCACITAATAWLGGRKAAIYR